MARVVQSRLLNATALALLSMILSGQPLAAAERVMIGTPSHGLFEFPVVIAMRKGFFLDEGLEVQKIQIQPQIGVKALVSGDIDYFLAWGSTLRAAATGVPLKVVLGIASRPLHVLIARPEIKSGQDLKGKILGVDSFAGTVDYLTRTLARHYGLEPDKDVKIIVTGPSPTRFAALKAGSIDATAIDVAFAVKAEEEGLSRLLYLGDIIELPISGIGVTDEKIAKQREQVKRVIRATLKGTRFMKQNRAEAARMLSEYLRITPGQAAKTYDTAIQAFTDDGYVSEKGIAVDLKLVKERLKLARDIPPSQVVDWSLLKEIR
ncbi:MAG TPA: ABC transporter substrate-binding protein [Candidatus Eisenbacteria bacterium]|nr:ABC transporter substrate-binding protein [Candidatus Eisenbacteria bacterium]